MGERLQWFVEKADNPPWIDALAELRQLPREGWRIAVDRAGYATPTFRKMKRRLDRMLQAIE